MPTITEQRRNFKIRPLSMWMRYNLPNGLSTAVGTFLAAAPLYEIRTNRGTNVDTKRWIENWLDSFHPSQAKVDDVNDPALFISQYLTVLGAQARKVMGNVW
jgi:hypothetical protein